MYIGIVRYPIQCASIHEGDKINGNVIYSNDPYGEIYNDRFWHTASKHFLFIFSIMFMWLMFLSIKRICHARHCTMSALAIVQLFCPTAIPYEICKTFYYIRHYFNLFPSSRTIVSCVHTHTLLKFIKPSKAWKMYFWFRVKTWMTKRTKRPNEPGVRTLAMRRHKSNLPNAFDHSVMWPGVENSAFSIWLMMLLNK